MKANYFFLLAGVSLAASSLSAQITVVPQIAGPHGSISARVPVGGAPAPTIPTGELMKELSALRMHVADQDRQIAAIQKELAELRQSLGTRP